MYINSNSEAGCDKLPDQQYGRRVEADRSGTVYHLFTGVPVDCGGGAMTGLSRDDAADRMLSLNRNGLLRHRHRTWLKPPAIDMQA